MHLAAYFAQEEILKFLISISDMSLTFPKLDTSMSVSQDQGGFGIKMKKNMFDRVFILILAIKSGSPTVFDYLLNDLYFYWGKDDLKQLLEYISEAEVFWMDNIEVVLKSRPMQIWFYKHSSEKKMDYQYQFERLVPMRFLTDKMQYQFRMIVSETEANAAFLHSYLNEKTVEGELPELSILSKSVKSVRDTQLFIIEKEVDMLEDLEPDVTS